MNDDNKNADINKDGAAPAADPNEKKDNDANPNKDDAPKDPPQDPIQQELDKVKNKGGGRSKREKLQYSKERIEEQLASLDEEQGVTPDPDEDDETPVTVGMLKKKEKEQAAKTALTLADEQITDESERELTKHHLKNTVKASGNPKEDLRIARAIVNDVKNRQILDEQGRKVDPKTHGSGAGAPARKDEAFEPTAEELTYMRPPFSLSKAQILAARKADGK